MIYENIEQTAWAEGFGAIQILSDYHSQEGKGGSEGSTKCQMNILFIGFFIRLVKDVFFLVNFTVESLISQSNYYIIKYKSGYEDC